MKKIYGYARVSTREQNLDRQIKALLERGVDERDIVTDKASGKSLEREGYQMLKSRMLRDGDVLVIKSLDRLSRNKTHIKQELEYFKNHHIRVMVIDLPTTLIELPEGQEWIFEMINNILIEVLASIISLYLNLLLIYNYRKSKKDNAVICCCLFCLRYNALFFGSGKNIMFVKII